MDREKKNYSQSHTEEENSLFRALKRAAESVQAGCGAVRSMLGFLSNKEKNNTLRVTKQPPGLSQCAVEKISELEMHLRQVCEKFRTGTLSSEAIHTLIEDMTRVNPEINVPQIADLQLVLYTICNIFNRYICVADKRVLLPINLQKGKWEEGKIIGDWEEFPSATGESAWAAEVQWGKSVSKKHNVALSNSNLAFFDTQKIYNHVGSVRYDSIVGREEKNSMKEGMYTYVKHLSPQEFNRRIVAEQVLFEEIGHCHDDSFVNIYAAQNGFVHPEMATVEALMRPNTQFYALWQEFLQLSGFNVHQNTEIHPIDLRIATGFSHAAHECSGQLRGVLMQMRKHIQSGDHERAYIVFLNFMFGILYYRDQAIATSATGKLSPSHPDFEYMLPATSVVSGMPLKNPSGRDIRDHCEGSSGSAAERALALIEQSFATNTYSDAERLQRISLVSG